MKTQAGCLLVTFHTLRPRFMVVIFCYNHTVYEWLLCASRCELQLHYYITKIILAGSPFVHEKLQLYNLKEQNKFQNIETILICTLLSAKQ